jgi:hypothetical protein
MNFISHSRFIFLTRMNHRMDLIQTIKEAWSGIRMGLRPMKIVYKLGSRRGIASVSGYTTVFQAEICAIKVCTMENTDKGYKGRNIYVLSDGQAAIKVLHNFQISSKLVWDCHESVVRLAERNRVQQI